MDEFASLDATGQAELVRRGEAKPSELVEAAVRRIEELNPKLNAVVTPMFDLALDAAAGDLPDGPFTGVPYLLKDLGEVEYAGVRFTEGSRYLQSYVAPHDSEMVSRLKAAGLIVLGKTNTPEFGILPTTEPALFGPARNPWDTSRSTGGSSGGSAAAVASGMVPAAHGNDGGGSIRIPASCCGLFGLKPTRARNPQGPDYGDIMSGLVSGHALTRSVRDSAALLDATSGPAPGDPYWAPPPARPFAREVGADPGRLRIAVVANAPTLSEIHPDCVEAVRSAAELCASLGHECSEGGFDLDGDAITNAFLTAWTAGVAWSLDHWARTIGRPATADDVEPLTWALVEMGRSKSAPDYLLAVQDLQRISREVAAMYQSYDVVLTPTIAEPPPLLGEFDSPPDDPLRGLMRAAALVPFTPIANITGQPAMSLPLHWNAGGLPIGVHVIGRFGDEATLLRLASQLEEASPWEARQPSL
jgi:amidase